MSACQKTLPKNRMFLQLFPKKLRQNTSKLHVFTKKLYVFTKKQYRTDFVFLKREQCTSYSRLYTAWYKALLFICRGCTSIQDLPESQFTMILSLLLIHLDCHTRFRNVLVPIFKIHRRGRI
jgi:hypothetical protein